MVLSMVEPEMDMPSPLAAWSSGDPPGPWPGGDIELVFDVVVGAGGGVCKDRDCNVCEVAALAAVAAADTALDGDVLLATCDCWRGDCGCCCCWSRCAAPRPNMAALRNEPFLRRVCCCWCCWFC